jgi:hypothetical protein
MGSKTTPSGKAVTCTACSSWTPVIGDDITAAAEAFDAHICPEHSPVRDIEVTRPAASASQVLCA